MRYSTNLGLSLPEAEEYFDISTWNTNMRILDEAYALLRDESGQAHPIAADLVTYDDTQSGLDANNVQAAIDKLAFNCLDKNTYHIDVTENMTITIATYAHIYIVLNFGNTAYNVTFKQSIPGSGLKFIWEGGKPTFHANSTYELSFLNLDCRWFKR